MSHKPVFPLYKTGVSHAPVINPDVISYSTQQQSLETVIERKPASQYFVLDSKNRFFTATPNQAIQQPWNNFRLQKAESLMQSFATRLTVSEIRFPWFIPNITNLNNTIYIIGKKVGDTVLSQEAISFTSDYYNPDEIMNEINLKITALNPQFQNPPEFSALTTGQTRIEVASDDINTPIYVSWTPVNNLAIANNSSETLYNFLTVPSLAKTLGLNFTQATFDPANPIRNRVEGDPSEYLYTSYIDIVSNKLNQYTTNLDGSSDITSNRLLVRLYLSDEISIFNNYDNQNIYAPFLIHRQFKNPKEVMWNKESVVDWLDISVRDEYGNLIELPECYNQSQTRGTNPNPEYKYFYTNKIEGSYPDFQITILASEN